MQITTEQRRSYELGDLITERAGRLADQLDTRVTVTGMARNMARGALVIEFADAEDLQGIVDAIDQYNVDQIDHRLESISEAKTSPLGVKPHAW